MIYHTFMINCQQRNRLESLEIISKFSKLVDNAKKSILSMQIKPMLHSYVVLLDQNQSSSTQKSSRFFSNNISLTILSN
jgi:hypothetical protein